MDPLLALLFNNYKARQSHRRQEKERKERCYLKEQNVDTPGSEGAARMMLVQEEVTTQDQGPWPYPQSSSPLTISYCFPEITPLTCPQPLGEMPAASSFISHNQLLEFILSPVLTDPLIPYFPSTPNINLLCNICSSMLNCLKFCFL